MAILLCTCIVDTLNDKTMRLQLLYIQDRVFHFPICNDFRFGHRMFINFKISSTNAKFLIILLT